MPHVSIISVRISVAMSVESLFDVNVRGHLDRTNRPWWSLALQYQAIAVHQNVRSPGILCTVAEVGLLQRPHDKPFADPRLS